MERNQFYKKISNLVDEWYIDTEPPILGTYKKIKHKVKPGPRKRINKHGEVKAPNESSGEVQILSWATNIQQCHHCNKTVCNRSEDIDLRKKKIRCSCGKSYPLNHCADKRITD